MRCLLTGTKSTEELPEINTGEIEEELKQPVPEELDSGAADMLEAYYVEEGEGEGQGGQEDVGNLNRQEGKEGKGVKGETERLEKRNMRT